MTIGTLGEKSLHAALKAWYLRPGDLLEARVAGYVIDIVRGDLLIEIQTRNFSAIRSKLAKLLSAHTVRLIHPIAQDRWIVRLDADLRTVFARRKSPRRGCVYHIFNELVHLPELVAHPNFSLEILLIQDEELRVDDGQGSWRRRGWSIADRRLLGVVGQSFLATPSDFLALLPDGLPQPFTNAELAAASAQPASLARRMTYCLRAMGLLCVEGKRGNAPLYSTKA